MVMEVIRSDVKVRNLNTPSKGYEDYKVEGAKSLYLRVSCTGTKKWRFLGRVMGSGKQSVYALGEYAPSSKDIHISLQKAKQKAEEYKAYLRAGIDPKALEDQKAADVARNKLEEEKRAKNTYQYVLNCFFTEHAELNLKPSTIAHMRSLLGAGDFTGWQDKPIDQILKRDVEAVIKRIEKRGVLVQARRSLAYLKMLFKWCVGEGYLPDEVAPPTYGVTTKLKKESKRKRWLSQDEIKIFWKAADDLGYPFGRCLQILLLTGQRRDEVAAMRRKDIDKDLKHWFQRENKADRSHIVPLNSLAESIIDELPTINESALFFTTNGVTPISGFSKAKRKLDAKIKDIIEHDQIQGAFEEPWMIHDLRRTMTTQLRRNGIPLDVCSRLLNHAEKGVTSEHYDEYDMLKEKTEAMKKWGSIVESITREKADNVVMLKRPN